MVSIVLLQARTLPSKALPYFCVALWTALLMMVNQEWYYNPISFADHAVYLGWALNPLSYRKIFSTLPSGDLLPLILPNALFYSLFAPLTANFVIKFLSCFLGNACLLFLTRRLFNLKTAVLCVVLFSCYRYTLVALGGEYTDGRVIVYFLLASSLGLAAVMRSSERCHWRTRKCYMLAASGFFAQMMFSTAILSIVLLPLVFCFSAVGESGISRNRLLAPVRAQLPPIAAGFIAGFVMLCLVDLFFYGGTGHYLHNSIVKMFSILGEDRGFVKNWPAGGMWLLLPLCVIPSGVGLGVRLIRKNVDYKISSPRGASLLVIMLASASAFFGYTALQFFFNQETISNLTYFNFTIPLVFLLAGIPFFQVSASLDPRQVRSISIVLAVLSLLIVASVDLCPTTLQWLLVLLSSSIHSVTLLAAFVALSSLCIALGCRGRLVRSIALGVALATISLRLVVSFGSNATRLQTFLGFVADSHYLAIGLGTVLLLLALLISLGSREMLARTLAMGLLLVLVNFLSASPLFPFQFSSKNRKSNFLTVLSWIKTCNELDRPRRDHIWYNFKEKPGAAYLEMSSATHMWLNGGVVGENFPDAPGEKMSRIKADVQANGEGGLILLSQKRDAQLLLRLRLRDEGMSVDLVMTKHMLWLNQPFDAHFFRLRPGS